MWLEVSVAVPRPGGSDISTCSGELCMEVIFKKQKKKKKANTVKVGMNHCVLSSFLLFPARCFQSTVMLGCWKCIPGRSWDRAWDRVGSL